MRHRLLKYIIPSVLFVVALVIGMIIAGGYPKWLPGGGPRSEKVPDANLKHQHSPANAWLMCQSFVEQTLLSPGSVEWPEHYKSNVLHLGGGRYRIASHVDSQNTFGALVRTKFIAELLWTGETSWRLELLILNGQQVVPEP